jgi:LytS/YehU family sensor histidine kinase
VIYKLNESTGALSQCAAHGPKNPELEKILSPIEIKLGEGIVGTVAKTGIAEIIPDTSHDPRYIVDDVRRYSEITVPIMAGDRVLGVIDSEHSKKRFFTQRHLTILSTIASLCAAKMIKAQAEAEKSETEQILMATKQQMADIEMQALRAQMNPHFIFNCLNSINRYIVKSDQATASLYLTRFAKLIRLILDNSNSKTVTLTNELEALRLYIEMESIRFEKQFTYNISLGDHVMPDHLYVPPLIIQPFVENAIWHGLLHKEGEGHLDIRIQLNGDQHLECTVEDNGVGRAKAKELKSKSASNTKSLGMKLTESRLALLNKQANWNAVVEVLDLVDARGEAAGTRVTIKIPMDS